MSSSSDDNQASIYHAAMQKLIHEHTEGLQFAAEISRIAEEGQQEALLAGIERVKQYDADELEFHLQHEEQTILGTMVRNHPEHAALCIAIGKEHGYIRTLVEEMSAATAKKDLAEFGRILKEHTIMENEQLFPLVEKLFTDEQLQAVAGFTPLQRAPLVETPAPADAKNSDTRQEWLTDIMAFIEGAGRQGGGIVLFPRFNPDLISLMAQRTGFKLFDFQHEVMAAYGKAADQVSLEEADNQLRNRAAREAIVVHNIEALLCVKSEQERRSWLQSFLDTDWPNPVLLPISIYQADVPNEHTRVCDLELHKIPRKIAKAEAISTNQDKYAVAKRS